MRTAGYMLSIPPAGAKISIGWLKLRYNSFFVNTQILCPGGAGGTAGTARRRFSMAAGDARESSQAAGNSGK
jgi:hypothetical protein